MLNVLLIENNTKIGNFISKTLKTQDCKVDICESSNTSFHYYSKFRYELVLINICTPNRNVFEIVLELKTIFKHTAVVIYGKQIDASDYNLFLELGVDIIFSENITPDSDIFEFDFFNFLTSIDKYSNYFYSESISLNSDFSITNRDNILYLLFTDGIAVSLDIMSNILSILKIQASDHPIFVDLSNINKFTDDGIKFFMEYINQYPLRIVVFYAASKSKGDLYANIFINNSNFNKTIKFFDNKLQAIDWIQNNRG